MGNRRPLTGEEACVMRKIGDGKKLVDLCGEMPAASNVEVARTLDRLVEEGRVDRFKIDRYESPTYAVSEQGESALEDYAGGRAAQPNEEGAIHPDEEDEDMGPNKRGQTEAPSPETVAAIRAEIKDGMPRGDVAKTYGVSIGLTYKYAPVDKRVKRKKAKAKVVEQAPAEVDDKGYAEELKDAKRDIAEIKQTQEATKIRDAIPDSIKEAESNLYLKSVEYGVASEHPLLTTEEIAGFAEKCERPCGNADDDSDLEKAGRILDRIVRERVLRGEA